MAGYDKRHYNPHLCPDCGLCWCNCDDCKTSLTQGCVCPDCSCEENHYHDDCPAWHDAEES